MSSSASATEAPTEILAEAQAACAEDSTHHFFMSFLFSVFLRSSQYPVPLRGYAGVNARVPGGGRFQRLVILGLALGAGWLAGCATTHLPGEPPAQALQQDWERHRLAVDALVAWELHGRLAVKTAGRGWQVRLVWRQRHQRFEIDLSSSVLGQGLARLAGGPEGVELQLAEGRYRAADAATLMRDHLGWSLPVQGLFHWLRGLPEAGEVQRLQLNAHGHLQELQQQGWIIRYARYRQVGDVMLPVKMELVHGGGKRRLHVRLVVDRWTLAGKGLPS